MVVPIETAPTSGPVALYGTSGTLSGGKNLSYAEEGVLLASYEGGRRTMTECAVVNPTTALTPPLIPIIAERPFELVQTDLIDMGRTSFRNRYCLTIVDHFSKWAAETPIQNKYGS